MNILLWQRSNRTVAYLLTPWFVYFRALLSTYPTYRFWWWCADGRFVWVFSSDTPKSANQPQTHQHFLCYMIIENLFQFSLHYFQIHYHNFQWWCQFEICSWLVFCCCIFKSPICGVCRIYQNIIIVRRKIIGKAKYKKCVK